MIAVIYSDSHDATWKLAQKRDSVICTFKTPGINPSLNDEKYINNIFNKNINLINHAEEISRIYFFGAGTFSKERKMMILGLFGEFFKNGKVLVDHDVKAAALAACGDQCGIVGILGSGSNAAYFDGKKVKDNNFGLGYILADEGSANWMGRVLLKHYLNETLPTHIYYKLTKRFDLDRKQILDKVYRRVHATLFLSHFSDFFLENKEDPFIKKIAIMGFEDFFSTTIVPLKKQHPHAPVHLVGTLASDFEPWLHEVSNTHHIRIDSIIKDPIDHVLDYYLKKNKCA